jgi:hypothetical protein
MLPSSSGSQPRRPRFETAYDDAILAECLYSVRHITLKIEDVNTALTESEFENRILIAISNSQGRISYEGSACVVSAKYAAAAAACHCVCENDHSVVTYFDCP